jgi:hypothetical protein
VITVTILGGLGNQMFQYAAAKALACRHGVEVVLDSGAFETYALRSFLLDRMQIPEAAVAAGKRSIGESLRAKSVASVRRLHRIPVRLGWTKRNEAPGTYSEPHFHFDPAFFELGSHVSLHGYFQSERYFGEIADLLRDFFRPRDPLGPAAQSMSDRIAGAAASVSIHIRRGDYVKNAETARVHGSLDAAYYRKALGILQGALKSEITIFVFSDDATAAEAVLDFIPAANLVHVLGDPDRPWEDMALMARCHHHVIANSSFSWWGAWLNPSSDKIVIAPRTWFTTGELRLRNTCDLCPTGWILI